MEKLDKAVEAELKAKLLEEKANLEKELLQFAKPTDTPGNYETQHDVIGEDQDDNATEVEEYADNLALENNLEKQLKEVNDALKRVEDGTYGYCENCGTTISLDRLRAYPAARNCIQCK
jgi:RNA polymerase-binding protein DksA